MAVPQHIYSGSYSELVTYLPVPTRGSLATRRVVYRVFLPNLRPGEVIDARSEMQVTNDLRYNVMWVTMLLLTPDPSSVQAGIEVTEPNGRNVTPNMHHDVQVKVQALEITSATAGNQYLNVVAWAASDAAPADGSARLKVDQDYGRLGVLRFS